MDTKKQMTEWKAQLTRQLGEASANAPHHPYNSFAEQAAGKIAFSVNGATGLNYELRLFNYKETIQRIADKVNKVAPKASRLGCARVPRCDRTPMGECLAVYGTAENAYPTLQRQLENASALGLDERQQNRLSILVWTLEQHLIKLYGSTEQAAA